MPRIAGSHWSALGEIHRRVYRFQPGDDRSTEREAIYKQLAASKKVPSHAEHLERKRLARPISVSMAERTREQYSRRRMPPR
jgi:hypothetical protein